MSRLIAAALAATALLAAGCSGDKKAAAKPDAPAGDTAAKAENPTIKSPADLFDFKVGDQWVYSMDQKVETAEGTQEFTMEVTMKVLDVKQDEDGVAATVATSSMDLPTGTVLGTDVLSWHLSDKGLRQTAVANGQQTYSPPLPLVPLPFTDGDTIQHTGTGPREGTDKPGPFQATLQMGGWQEVDTDMGRMKAYAINGVRKFTVNEVPFTSVITLWVAPEHGIVRALSETSTPQSRVTVLRRIKSHTQAKGS